MRKVAIARQESNMRLSAYSADALTTEQADGVRDESTHFFDAQTPAILWGCHKPTRLIYKQ